MVESMTILVVDDMEINRVILTELFQQECTVLEAENGKVALELLEAHPETDIVIMDIVMPVMDGFETLHTIRESARFSNLPVVICTEHAEVDMQVRALDLGSTDFITKPFNARVVRHRIRNLIEVRKMERKIAEQQRVAQLRDILNSIVSPLGLFEFTNDIVRAIYLNQGFFDMFSAERDELQYFFTNMLESLVPEDAEHLVELFRQNQEDGSPVDITYRVPQKDHSVSMHEMHALSIRYEHFENPVYLASITDITHQRRTEVALRDTDQRLKSLINAIPGAILTLEATEPVKVTYFNDTACDILNLTRAELQAHSQDIGAFIHGADLPQVRNTFDSFIANPDPFSLTFRVVPKDKDLRWIRVSGAPIITAEGTLLCNCVCIDISTEKESELKLEQAFKEMQYRSEHDRLTDIWNRETFNLKTHELLDANPGNSYVLLAMNIQRFKVINDLFGASVGDEVLRTMSRALQRMVSDFGTCGRMEADHFMACIPASNLNMDLIVESFDRELKMKHSDYRIELFFGVYEIRDAQVAVDQMCDRATMALKTIKGSAIKRYAVYDDAMRKNLLEEQEIIEEMQAALDQGQFIPYLQPIFGLNNLRPVGAEVLVRWLHPVKGLIPPGVFVPLFEQNGFITKLDFSIWEQACMLLHRWKAEGAPLVPLSINISRIDLYQPHLCESLQDLLKKYDLDISLLKLEITESAYIDDPDVLPSVLKRFRTAGFQILMDDFGSGYSSLNTLKDMPINIMKIDMCFLAELEDSPRAASILTSVVRMAKWLDMPVVAEGVETKAQLEFLHSIGCDMGQGYYFSKPLSVPDFEELMRAENPAAFLSQISVNGPVDLDLLWNSGTEVNLLFNSMIGGMAVFEIVNGELRAQRINDAYYQVVGCTPQDVFDSGANPLGYLEDVDRNHLLEVCQRAATSEKVEVIDVRRKQDSTHPACWLEYRIRHMTSVEDYSVFFFIVSDVTAQKELEFISLPAQNSVTFRNAFTDVFEMNITKDRFSHVYNAAGESLAPLCTIAEARKREGKLIHPDDKAAFDKSFQTDFLRECTQNTPHQKAYTFELRKQNSEGIYEWASFALIRLDLQGSDEVYLLCASDADPRAQGESVRDTQWEQDHFRLLAECPNSLTFDYSVETDTMTFYFYPNRGESSRRVLTQHLGTLAGSPLLVDEYKPIYLKAFQQACQEPVVDMIEFPASFEGEPFHWCRAHYVSLTDDKGNVFRIVGRILDINREKQAEELLLMEQQYRKVFFSETLFVFDIEPDNSRYDLLHQAEDAEEQFFPYIHYLRMEDGYIHPNDLTQAQAALSLEHLRELYDSGRTEYRVQARIKNRQEQWVWVEFTLHLLKVEDSASPRFIMYMKVVDHQKRREAELRTRAETDSISLLYNRGAIQERISKRLLDAPNESHAFFLFDIDNFKHVNDSLGHATGDEVIQSIATVLRRLFRATDLTGRLGGDEFVAFMSYDSEGGEGNVRDKAKRAVEAISKITLPGHSNLWLTASIGIAIAPADGITFDALYQNADKALYSVKKEGKNGFALYGNLQGSEKQN